MGSSSPQGMTCRQYGLISRQFNENARPSPFVVMVFLIIAELNKGKN
jgi:hypothetical protein